MSPCVPVSGPGWSGIACTRGRRRAAPPAVPQLSLLDLPPAPPPPVIVPTPAPEPIPAPVVVEVPLRDPAQQPERGDCWRWPDGIERTLLGERSASPSCRWWVISPPLLWSCGEVAGLWDGEASRLLGALGAGAYLGQLSGAALDALPHPPPSLAPMGAWVPSPWRRPAPAAVPAPEPAAAPAPAPAGWCWLVVEDRALGSLGERHELPPAARDEAHALARRRAAETGRPWRVFRLSLVSGSWSPDGYAYGEPVRRVAPPAALSLAVVRRADPPTPAAVGGVGAPPTARPDSAGATGIAIFNKKTEAPTAPRSLLGRPWLVLDTETTGLRRSGPGHAEVHQLAAVLLSEDGEEVAVWEGRACPRRLSGWEVARALEVSGTRAADLRGYPPPPAMLARFWEWYVGHGSPVATAYNRPFDEAILRCEEVVLDWGPCLQQRAQQALHTKRLKLERAAELLQIPLPGGQTHQALDDARLAAAVLVALARRRTGRAAA